MKLWKKLTFLFLLFLLASLSVCGGITLYQTQKASVGRTIANYQKQLEAVAYVFEQFSMRQEFEEMTSVVQNAYLQFEFKKCCGEGYALLKNGNCVINLTDYDVIDPFSLSEEGRVQRVGYRNILILKTDLVNPEGYEIFSIQDITDTYREIKQQMKLYLVVYILTAAVAAGCVAVVVKKLLNPLKELEQAAGELRSGNLSKRVSVKSIDEIGDVGLAFNEMAEEVERQVDDLKLLLGALNHEIKTPMTSIIGYSESLLHVKLTEEQREAALLYIYQEGRRLESLSGKMMSLLGLYEEGIFEFCWLEVDVLFQRVAEMEDAYLKEHGMTLQFEYNGKESFYVDQTLMESMLGNLIQNGVRASEPGSTIILREIERGLEVEDFGRGIPKEEIKNITKAFYMVDKSRSREAGGAGLGLAICKQIVDVHQAEMVIESEEGRGTIVRIVFSNVYKTFTGC